MSDILKRAQLVRREIFNPAKPAHIASLKTFLVTNTWGDVQFYPEAPYTEAPATVLAKFANYKLGVEPESVEVRIARLAARNVVPMPDLPEFTEEARVANLAHLNRLVKTA